MHVWSSERSVQLKRKVIFSGLKYILSTYFIRQLQYVRWKDRPYTHANMKSFNFTINFIFLSNVLLVLLSNANIGNSKNEIIKLFKSITYFSSIAIKHLDLYTLRFKSANFDWAAHRLFSRITNFEPRSRTMIFFCQNTQNYKSDWSKNSGFGIGIGNSWKHVVSISVLVSSIVL